METFNFIPNVYGRENAIETKDYPYGFRLRTSRFIWLEKKKENGVRVCTSTINPKNGKENAPKKSVYYDYARLYIEEETGYIKAYTYNVYTYEGFKKVKDLGVFETPEEIAPFECLFSKHLN